MLKKLLIDSVYDRVSRLDESFVAAGASILVVVDEVITNVHAVQARDKGKKRGITEESCFKKCSQPLSKSSDRVCRNSAEIH